MLIVKQLLNIDNQSPKEIEIPKKENKTKLVKTEGEKEKRKIPPQISKRVSNNKTPLERRRKKIVVTLRLSPNLTCIKNIPENFLKLSLSAQ